MPDSSAMAGDVVGNQRRSRQARMRDGDANESNERQPLLLRPVFSHEPEAEPLYSCVTNTHSHLPVYTNIHRIRRDIISVVEDFMTLEQLRDVRINVSVVRPLVDQLYELDDISIGAFPVPGFVTRLQTTEIRRPEWRNG